MKRILIIAFTLLSLSSYAQLPSVKPGSTEFRFPNSGNMIDTFATKADVRAGGGTSATLYSGTGSNTDGAMTQAAATTLLGGKADTSGYLKQYFDKSVFINSAYKYVVNPDIPGSQDTTMFYVKGRGANSYADANNKYIAVFADSSDRQVFSIDNGGRGNLSSYGTTGGILAIGKYSTAIPTDFNHIGFIFKGSQASYTAGSIISRVLDTTTTGLKSDVEINVMNGVNANGSSHAQTNVTYTFYSDGFYIPGSYKLNMGGDVSMWRSANGQADFNGSLNIYNTLYTNNLRTNSAFIGNPYTTPNSSLQTLSFSTGYVAKSTSYTATISDYTIEVTATGQTITLPTAVGIKGRQYIIKLTASGSATVATTSSQTIDGATTYTLSAQYKYVNVQSNGANWLIIANN